MNRRAFFKSAAAIGATCFSGSPLLRAADSPAGPASRATAAASRGFLHGVNLGGWLVLEKWMTPDLYAGTNAEDEYSLAESLGKNRMTDLLKRHRETWITADDFSWLARHGINSVRLPVGYGVLEENAPFITGVDTLDNAFAMARANRLSVLLDLHGVPGSQNGWDHSGRAGKVLWPSKHEYIAHSLNIIDGLARHCSKHENLLGIELVNEPAAQVPLAILKDYYQEGYDRVRTHLSSERAAVVIHDGFRAFDWAGFMPPPKYQNVILDTHLYHCFTEEDRKRDLEQHRQRAAVDRRSQLERMQHQLPCMVGEWSLGLDRRSTAGTTGAALDSAMRAFGNAQLATYETTRGWYFWSYKVHDRGGWNFRDCVERGWLPEQLGSV
jgi:glucan 1,3-beta-glucosidase